jgi:flavin-dependent dehydrogenase
MPERFDTVVVGGGPAGSVAATSIASCGYHVALLEKLCFPRETLCGEFLSEEVDRVISEMGLQREFQALRPNPLRSFKLLPQRSSPVRAPLGFTAYGVRRGAFDSMLLDAARRGGVSVIQPAEATAIERDRRGFVVRYRYGRDQHTCHAAWVIAAYGKSSFLHKQLGRTFAGKRTGFIGFKYHVPQGLIENLGNDEIAIALGPRGYCGISRVDSDAVTVCALERREKGNVSTHEYLRALARVNPHFGRVVTAPALAIVPTLPVNGTGNLYFGHREIAVNGVLMVGDAAGMIAPLAGDGISIAMQQGRLIGRLFAEVRPHPAGWKSFSNLYRRESERMFAPRKRLALLCQHIAMSDAMRPAITPLLSLAPGLLAAAIERTRGSARDRSASGSA